MSQPYPTIEEIHARIGSVTNHTEVVLTTGLVKIICDLDRARRGGEGVEVERIDWEAMQWATHVAADENGVAFAFGQEPTKMEFYWAPKPRSRCSQIDATIPGPWTESLRKRPENV